MFTEKNERVERRNQHEEVAPEAESEPSFINDPGLLAELHFLFLGGTNYFSLPTQLPTHASDYLQ